MLGEDVLHRQTGLAIDGGSVHPTLTGVSFCPNRMSLWESRGDNSPHDAL